MITVTTTDTGVARLTFNSGRGNPLTPALLDLFNQKMDELCASPPRALIIDTDGASIFSGGFALPIVASWPRADLSNFFEGFLDILYKILSLPCITISVIDGHAIAGGFILSLASDLRFVKEGRSTFGLSEVDLGVALPAGAGVLFEARTSPKDALFYSMTGNLFNTTIGKEIGYAFYTGENPLADAMQFAENSAKKPGRGTGYTRVFFNERIAQQMRRADDQFMNVFLDTWFSDEGQQAIKALAQKLGKK